MVWGCSSAAYGTRRIRPHLPAETEHLQDPVMVESVAIPVACRGIVAVYDKSSSPQHLLHSHSLLFGIVHLQE